MALLIWHFSTDDFETPKRLPSTEFGAKVSKNRSKKYQIRPEKHIPLLLSDKTPQPDTLAF